MSDSAKWLRDWAEGCDYQSQAVLYKIADELERLQTELAHANALKTQWKEQLIVSKHIEDSLHKQLDAKEVELASLRKQIDEMQRVPEGWQLINRNMTPEQRQLLLRADEFTVDEMWIMLLAAAPQPEDGNHA